VTDYFGLSTPPDEVTPLSGRLVASGIIIYEEEETEEDI
jgi:hypothetical protein